MKSDNYEVGENFIYANYMITELIIAFDEFITVSNGVLFENIEIIGCTSNLYDYNWSKCLEYETKFFWN